MQHLTRAATLLAITVFAVPAVGSLQAMARASGTDKTLKMIDKDSDGTIDLNEAKAAGGAAFDKLDKDKDGTLDAKELKGRLSRANLRAADTDNDGTLTKDEYLANVNGRFNLTDTDNEGTVDAKELRSPAGQTLTQLLK